jgi:ferric-dicitrate binding protein FerR (iron transport regulator)
MTNVNEKFEIIDFIVKSINDTLADHEKIILDQWINSSSQNKELYDHLQSKKALNQKAKEYSSINIEKELNIFNQRQTQQRSSSSSIKEIIRYAASVAAVIAISLLLYIALDYKPLENIQTAEIPLIAPGSKKATLTLADGRIIELSKLKNDSLITENGLLIKTEGSKISYIGYTQINLKGTSQQKKIGTIKPTYHILNIPRGGEYDLTLPDGTKVWINSETKLEYPAFFEKGKSREIRLTGEAYFEVAKDTAHPFIIKLIEKGEIKVLGTHFNVMAYEKDNRVLTTLVEGKVSYRFEKSGKEIILNPGQQAIALNSGLISVKEVNIEEYIGWKDGLHVFKDRRLEDIMSNLERWYNVNVNYEDSSLKNLIFSGNLKRYENINKLLRVFEATRDVKFKIKENEITIRKL